METDPWQIKNNFPTTTGNPPTFVRAIELALSNFTRPSSHRWECDIFKRKVDTRRQKAPPQPNFDPSH